MSRILSLLNVIEQNSRGKKAFSIFLSAFIALILWVLVTLNQDYEIPLHIRMRIVEVPDSIQVTHQDPLQLTIVTKGTGLDLMLEYFKAKKDTLELPFLPSFQQNQRLSSRSYIDHINSHFHTNALDIVRIKPDNILLDYDYKVFRKVPVELQTEIGLLPAFQFREKPILMTDSVKLYGVESRLNEIQSWRTISGSTDPIDGPQMISVPVDTGKGVEVSPSAVQVFANPLLYTEAILEIPVHITNIPQNREIRLSHQSIILTCILPFDQYEQITSLVASSIIEIPYKDLDPNHPSLVPEVRLPNGVKLIYRDPLEVSYVIVQKI